MVKKRCLEAGNKIKKPIEINLKQDLCPISLHRALRIIKFMVKAKKKKSLLDRKQKFARKEKGTEQSKMSEFIAAFVLLF